MTTGAPIAQPLFIRLAIRSSTTAGSAQSRCVAKGAKVVLGDLAQDAAHDLARPRFGQARRPLERSGLAIGPISVRTQASSSLRRLSVGSTPFIKVT